MSRANITPEIIARDAEAIRQHLKLVGAVQAHDIAKHIGRGRDFTYQVIAECVGIRKMKLGNGPTLWMLEAEYQTRKARTQAESRDRRNAKLRAQRLADPGDCEDWAINRRYVAAGSAPVPVTRAARSVFEWRPA